jgi:hypothetical protein
MTMQHALWHVFVIIAALAATSDPALAAVPTRDQAILNERTETSIVTVRLLDTTTKTETNTKGIRCATTTGQRGTVRDTSEPVAPNGGDQRLRQFDPGIGRAPESAGNQGRNAQQRSLLDGASTVIGGVETQQSVIPATLQQYQQMERGVGTAPTVMGAFDQNSAVRIQNGLTWNQTTQSANLLVQALNTANLFNVGQLSAGATGMDTGLPLPDPNGNGGTCLAGYLGRGTVDDPCRPANAVCSTTPPGVAPDPACVSQRYIDDRGNVAVYLGGVQDASLTALTSAPAAPIASPVPTQPTAADIAAALQSYQ